MSRIFARFYENGGIGFYPETAYPAGPRGGINENVPDGAIEVSQEDYDLFFSEEGHKWQWEDGKLVARDMTPPVAPMPTLTPRQFELFLIDIGITTEVIEGQINQIYADDDIARQKALVEFRRASVYERNHPLVDMVAAAIGFTSEEMDTMWRFAGDL